MTKVNPLILVGGQPIYNRHESDSSIYYDTLATALRTCGARVGLLIDNLGEQTKYQQTPTYNSYSFQWIKQAAKAKFGLWPRLSVRELPISMIDLKHRDSPLPQIYRIFNGVGFTSYPEAVFSLSGKTTRMILQEKVSAVHWASPVSMVVPGVPNLYTLHDLIPLQFPHLVPHRGAQWARLHQAVIKSADLIVSVSERCREDICTILGVPEARVANTYQPVSPLPVLDSENAARLVRNVYCAKPFKYAFFCGPIEPKKNLYRLIDAFLMADTDLQLLIAGPLTSLYDDVLEIIAVSGARFVNSPGRAPVRWLGYLPRRHVLALMQCARFFAFPSIYEGFGRPVVEAMQLGTPVLTSSGGSLPEIVGEAAQVTDPLDVAAMAAAVRRLADDNDLCTELARRGPAQAEKFSCEAYQRRLSAAYGKIDLHITHQSLERDEIR